MEEYYEKLYYIGCELFQHGGKFTKKWKEFKHNGVYFPPEYEQHNIPIIYNGEKINLDPLSEEYATLYAKYTVTEYVKNKTFNKNFWKDWKKVLPKKTPIQNLDDVDFSLILKHLENEKLKKKELSKEVKTQIKEENDKKVEKYKIAIVDEKEEPVGNFRMEPPGLFLGRGCHPLAGKIKKRILPKDITLNLSKDAKIPELPDNQKWGKIIHNKDNWWLASWKDTITGKSKYVWLSDSSSYKSASDMKKFELARKLKKKIGKIRSENEENLKSDDIQIKQLATCLALIDKLALRVGNEKGKDSADTVGVSSLRVEHIEFLDNNKIKLDFLGKDSVRYVNKFDVPELVYNNLQLFVQNKNNKDALFNKINPDQINKYLQTFMKELTSKVFRTYNASNLFQKELRRISSKFETYDKDDKKNVLLDEYVSANKKVALLCNHQKAVNKNFNESIKRIDDKIKDKRNKIKQVQRNIAKLRDDDTKSAKKKIKSKNKKIKKLKEGVNKYKSLKKSRIELKSVSLGTSKINYIDPRISVSFIKKHNMDLKDVFNANLQNKFAWALDVDNNWMF
jgi:DNA topoisomerase-1